MNLNLPARVKSLKAQADSRRAMPDSIWFKSRLSTHWVCGCFKVNRGVWFKKLDVDLPW